MSNVYAGMQDEFGVLAYSQKNPSTIQFLNNRFTEGVASFSQTLTDYGRTFYEKSAEVFYNAVGSDAMRYASSVLRKVNNMFQRDEIRSLWELSDVQQAPMSMQRYLMANPAVRTLYHDQRVDGYQDTYIDVQPNVIGFDHDDWRLATNGMVRFDDPDSDTHISYHYDVMPVGQVELHPDQKHDIASAWDLIEGALKIAGGDDPVSPTGGKL